MEIIEQLRERLSRALSRLPSQFRLMLLSIGVGIVAGLGAILFDRLLGWTLHTVLQAFTGYAEPRAGSSAASLFTLAPVRSLWFFIIPALGGLVSGVIVYLVAPEAEGHGTDAMIDAFHHKGGKIRKRVPFVKIIASAITIGTGGSAGKEGPIAQIGSGFGSAFASLLKLKARERRILVLAGAAGGIGAIFQAPLGAALFAPEVLYRETEFEYEAILPCIVSSITALPPTRNCTREGRSSSPVRSASPFPASCCRMRSSASSARWRDSSTSAPSTAPGTGSSNRCGSTRC